MVPEALVLFDGDCVLCNRAVHFVRPRQRGDTLDYASLQSERGQAILWECGLSTSHLDTFVLYEGGRCHTYSDAVLHLARYMRFPWPLLSTMLLVPNFVRRLLYNWVARNRYDWFGKMPHA